MSGSVQYMTFPGAAPSSDALALTKATARLNPQKFKESCGYVLIATGTLGALAGASLIIKGVSHFKALPFLSDSTSIGLGITLIVVGGAMIGSGIFLMKKTKAQEPARIENGISEASADALMDARRRYEFALECADTAYRMDIGNAESRRRAIVDPLRKRIDELQAELGRVNVEYDKALAMLEAHTPENEARRSVATAEYRRATSELKRHLGEAKEQFRQQATQAFAEYQREQQSALARLAAAKQQAANA